MIRSYKVNAIILSRRNIGEADKILTLFTREFGKKQVVAKGIRRITSRRAPYLEPFSYVQMILHQGKTFDIVTEVQSIETFELLRNRLERIGFVYIALELTERLTAENQEAVSIFETLVNFVRNLSQASTTRLNVQQELRSYKQFLLEELGFLQQSQKAQESFLDQKIEAILESPLKSPALLTNIQISL